MVTANKTRFDNNGKSIVKVPSHSLEAEKQVLGAIISKDSCLPAVMLLPRGDKEV